MPNKKGSKVAASKARAQVKAKKKARQTGPALAAAAYVPPPPETEDGPEHRADANARELSGRERQRVAIARALVNEPALLLADEPTGNLDSKTGLDVMEILHALRRRTEAALVLVTHNQAICRGADRLFEMRDGRLTGL